MPQWPLSQPNRRNTFISQLLSLSRILNTYKLPTPKPRACLLKKLRVALQSYFQSIICILISWNLWTVCLLFQWSTEMRHCRSQSELTFSNLQIQPSTLWSNSAHWAFHKINRIGQNHFILPVHLSQ